MLTLKIIVKVSEYKQLEFENAIKELVNSIALNKNILNNGITKDLNNKNIYFYEEEWNSREAMETHFKSNKFQTIIGAMRVLGNITDAKIIHEDKKEIFKQIIN